MRGGFKRCRPPSVGGRSSPCGTGPRGWHGHPRAAMRSGGSKTSKRRAGRPSRRICLLAMADDAFESSVQLSEHGHGEQHFVRGLKPLLEFRLTAHQPVTAKPPRRPTRRAPQSNKTLADPKPSSGSRGTGFDARPPTPIPIPCGKTRRQQLTCGDQQRHDWLAFQNHRFYSARHETSL